jgi:hypothetical protein
MSPPSTASSLGLSSMAAYPVQCARPPSPWALRFHSPQTEPHRPPPLPHEVSELFEILPCKGAHIMGRNQPGRIDFRDCVWSQCVGAEKAWISAATIPFSQAFQRDPHLSFWSVSTDPRSRILRGRTAMSSASSARSDENANVADQLAAEAIPALVRIAGGPSITSPEAGGGARRSRRGSL